MTTRALLNADEIRRLDQIYRTTYADALRARASEPLACHIHLPKLPEPLSLSIAALVAPHVTGEVVVAGRWPHDLETRSGRGVAVKGTGPSRWITMTTSDRLADWLVWVDYAERIRGGAPVNVLIVPISEGLSDAPPRLTRTQLFHRCSSFRTIRFDPRTGMLSLSSCPDCGVSFVPLPDSAPRGLPRPIPGSGTQSDPETRPE